MPLGNVISQVQSKLPRLGISTENLYKKASDTLVVAMSSSWVGISTYTKVREVVSTIQKEGLIEGVKSVLRGKNPDPDRFDSTQLYSLQIGDYFMPMSQTFSVRAKKRLNVSSLIDGIDIIQQTRKEAKTIECSLRLSLREGQTNMQIVEADNYVVELSTFLYEFYEKDAIFRIQNEMINDAFGVEHVFISEYRFSPRAGHKGYQFDFSLTEVQVGEEVLIAIPKDIQEVKPFIPIKTSTLNVLPEIKPINPRITTSIELVRNVMGGIQDLTP